MASSVSVFGCVRARRHHCELRAVQTARQICEHIRYL
jgi:hypothetical protein